MSYSFVGSCLVSIVSRHVRFTQKEHFNKLHGEDLCSCRQWRRGKRASREHDAVDSTEAEFSLKVRKDLPRRRGDPIPARGERSGTGRTDEGQSRRIVSEVCPVKRPLLSVAKITKAGNQENMAEDKAFVKNNKTGQITNLRRERNVWMLDLWVKRPADAMGVSSFQRLGR